MKDSSRLIIFAIGMIGHWSLVTGHLEAASYYPQLTYRYQHHLFFLDPDMHPSWRSTEEVWLYNGKQLRIPAVLRVDGDNIPSLPEGITRSLVSAWDADAIAVTLREEIASILDRPRGSVTISRDDEGTVVFDGVGLLGQELNVDRAATLTVEALENGITDIVLPVAVQQPVISVLDPELQDMGIREVVAIGESDFSYSPGPRRHNIANGLDRFDGHLVAQGETFSFNQVLGPVNASTGYLKELVIKGDKTLPDYGGGLCQISTTAYRGVWEYGFPIVDRRNHSFAVNYYAPQGTDATIYPPATDMKFINDSPGALLIQTYEADDKAYFIYYGTRDGRVAEIVGPYTWDYRQPPPDREEYTAEVLPGEIRKVGKATPGMQAAWFRILTNDEGEIVEPYYSFYEARPNFTQIGISSLDTEPDWIAPTLE